MGKISNWWVRVKIYFKITRPAEKEWKKNVSHRT